MGSHFDGPETDVSHPLYIVVKRHRLRQAQRTQPLIVLQMLRHGRSAHGVGQHESAVRLQHPVHLREGALEIAIMKDIE